jgi:PAS domain S-box-containing protein
MAIGLNMKKGVFFSFIILIVFGAVFIHYTWINSINTIEEHSLKIAKTIALSLDGEMLKQLKAIPEDEGTQAYESIKKRLLAVRDIQTGIRFAYLYTQKEGKIYFMADSEPVDSEDYSPPGQGYAEAEIEYLKPFDDAKAFITHPVKDRWGTWISVLVPIKNHETDNIRAVFGMDYNAANFYDEAKYHTIITGIVVLLVFLLFFAFVRLLKQTGSLKNEQKMTIQANEKLKESLEQFEQIFNTSPDAATITELRSGKIINVNDHFVSILGYAKPEIIGKPVLNLWKNPEERIKLSLKLSKNKYCENFEAEFIKKDGSSLCGLISAQLINLKGVPHIIGMTRDLSQLKQDEKEKNRLKIELQQSQRMQSIGTLAAGIAHEINSPLQFTNDNVDFISNALDDIMKLVNTYKNLMMSCHTDEDKENAKNTIAEIEKKINLEFLTKEMPDALTQTKEGIARIRKIVNAMKNYSNFNNEEKKPANINETLENAELISRNEWKYHAEVENEFAQDMQYLNCYEPELNQVFMNLIVNAAHTTKDAVDQKIIEKGRIFVKTSMNNNKFLIVISDNGLGIPKEYQERVYDPFFTTKEVGKGTGQGLSIAHKIVTERHGGKIWFETELNKGTTFYVEIPL